MVSTSVCAALVAERRREQRVGVDAVRRPAGSPQLVPLSTLKLAAERAVRRSSVAFAARIDPQTSRLLAVWNTGPGPPVLRAIVACNRSTVFCAVQRELIPAPSAA